MWLECGKEGGKVVEVGREQVTKGTVGHTRSLDFILLRKASGRL